MKPKLSFMTSNEGFTVTQDKYQPGWIMPYLHYHNYYEIYILEYGERLVQIDNDEFPADAHSATMFYKNISHKSSGETAFGGICVSFDDSFLNKYLQKSARDSLLKCFDYKILTLTDEEFEMIKTISDSFFPFDKRNFIRLISILDTLNSAAERVTPNDAYVSSGNGSDKSQLILKYVDDNYRTIKSSKEITELFGVSESYFFKMFKRKHGVSPKQYINNLKLRHACQFLIYRHDRTAKTIAADCGFESYEHFMRLFKQKMGCTPLEYRENNPAEK